MTKQEFEEMVFFKLFGKDEMLVLEFISYWTETSLKGKTMDTSTGEDTWL